MWLADSDVPGAKMQIDPALLSTISGLLGALIGGSASVTAAVYTQRYQDRLQRVAREATKRETVYADFIVSASKLLLNAYLLDGFKLDSDGQHLLGLANRMRLFAPPNIIDEGDQTADRDLAKAERGSSETRDGRAVQETGFRPASTIQPGLSGGPG